MGSNEKHRQVPAINVKPEKAALKEIDEHG
jgi:hypothetical protein